MKCILALAAVAVGVLVMVSCHDSDCLAPVSLDSTPPDVEMVIYYRSVGSAAVDTLVITSADSSHHVEAAADAPVEVFYAAHDPEGVRRVQLGVARLTTVAVGIDSKRIPGSPRGVVSWSHPVW